MPNVEDSKPGELALAAIALKQASEEFYKQGLAALKAGDMEALSALTQKGWRPDVQGSDQYVEAAFGDESGRSARWLLQSYPVETVESEYWNEKNSRARSLLWRAKPMSEFAPLSLSRPAGLGIWLDACMHAESQERSAYLKEALEDPTIWGSQCGAPQAIREALKYMRVFEEIGVAALAAKACAAWIEEVVLAAKEAGSAKKDRIGELDKLSKRAFFAVSKCRVKKDLEPIWRAFGESSLSMEVRGVSATAMSLTGRGSEIEPEDLREPTWGAMALVSEEAGPEMFDLALDQGWIAPMEMSFEIHIDNPDWIGGRHWDASPNRAGAHGDRLASTRLGIELSILPEAEKKRLLAKLEPDGVCLWSMGKSRSMILPGMALASPLEVMLACAESGVGERELDRRARALADRGYLFGDALKAPGAWGDKCRMAASDRRNIGWAGRALEREALSEASLPGIKSGKSPSL